MIIKSFEFKKIDIKKYNFYLFYGENEGLKKELIDNNFKKYFENRVYSYEENYVLNNEKEFFETILTKSFFDVFKYSPIISLNLFFFANETKVLIIKFSIPRFKTLQLIIHVSISQYSFCFLQITKLINPLSPKISSSLIWNVLYLLKKKLLFGIIM